MEYVDVQEVRVPALGLGTWQLQGLECRRTVEHALEIGYRHIDTAEGYDNEADVGAAIRDSGIEREELFLTSKVWPDHLAYDALLRSAHDSLKRLGTDRLDLLLIHWPNPEVTLDESFRALRRLQEEGAVSNIGVSNFPAGLLRQALELAPLLCIQVEYHPYLDQSPLLELAQAHDLVFTAYCPLARGKVAEDEVLRDIGRAYDKSPAQVVLRWLLQQPNVAAIPKARSERHLHENLGIFDFALDAEQARRVRELARGERLIDPDFAPDWSR